ncbi:uncharacterized protein LOC142089651 isoform X2 [Calonectris borealis]|uniref:uncharacterized protein LOC142089651 isoform X2 n=1 Tax=Calonectris borealis TaxID=1323832 RepID=UPI003F4B822A
MSGPGAQSRSRRLPADMEQAQRSLDAEQMQQQQLKLRDRQKFFEEVFQHDVDFFFPMSHLQIEHRRPPLGSISSMEVNVDMLEQMDMMDLSDQDTVDVFLGCGTEESSVAGPLPALATCVQIHTHPYKDRHLVLGSVRLEGPCQYPPPQPRGTDPCIYALQKTGDPRHFPVSVGQILLSSRPPGAASVLSRFPRSPLHTELTGLSRSQTPPPSQTPGSWACVLQGKPGVPVPSSPHTHAAVIHRGQAKRLLACCSQRPHAAWLRAVFHARQKRLHCQKRGRNGRHCPEPSRGCEGQMPASAQRKSPYKCPTQLRANHAFPPRPLSPRI